MPVLKVLVPAAHLPADSAMLHAFGNAVTAACQHWLQASADKVQCSVVPAVSVAGAPAYVEVLYRNAAHRDAAALAGFAEAIEQAVQRTFACVPRIRCIAIDPAVLYARH